jgi:general secretion pathway protein D
MMPLFFFERARPRRAGKGALQNPLHGWLAGRIAGATVPPADCALRNSPRLMRPVLRASPAVGLLLALNACSLPNPIGDRQILGGGYGAEPGLVASTPPENAASYPVQSFGNQATSISIATSASGLPVVAGTQRVRLDYINAPITMVASQVLGDILKLPFTIDSSVNGTMTLQVDNVAISDLPARLAQALRTYGYAMVSSGGTVRVGTISDIANAQSPDQTVTQLIPLSYVQPGDVIAAVQRSAPDSVTLSLDPLGRGIIASGSASAVNEVADLAALFDVDTFRNRSFGLYPLVNVTPSTMVQELRTVFASGQSQRPPRFAPISQLNGVLVVTDTPQ